MKPSIPKGTRDFSPQEMVRRNYIFDTIKQVFQRYGYLPIETPAMENLSTLMGKYGEEGDKLIFKILDSGEYFDSFKRKELKLKDENENIFELKLEESAGFTNYLNKEFYPENQAYLNEIQERLKKGVENEESNKIKEKLQEFQSKLDSVKEKTLLYFQEMLEKKEKLLSFQQKINDLKSSELTKYISEKALKYDLTVPFARYVVQHQSEITFPFKRYQIQPVWRADRPQKGRYREFYQCDADVVGSTSDRKSVV